MSELIRKNASELAEMLGKGEVSSVEVPQEAFLAVLKLD